MASAREMIGGRATVALTAAAAVLSVVTGITNIGRQSFTGSLATYVPEVVAQTAGFTGALTGFLMFASVLGLRRRFRLAWSSTAVLLPLTAAQGLLQSSPASVPLVVVSLVALPVVLFNHSRFDRELDFTTTQVAALAAIVSAQAYGTFGTFALREAFPGVDTLTDAFYFTMVTGSTVGYGDVTPAPTSESARMFALSSLLVNVASFAVALGVLLTPAIEARLTRALGRMSDSDLKLLENHILVLGYGELTDPIIEELAGRAEYVVVTPDEGAARQLTDRDVRVLTGDPSDEEPLRRAQIESARAAVAATNDDAQDALAILTARQLNPEVRIVAAATHRENVNKLKRAGANTVISPATIGGHLLVESALGGEGTEALADRLVGTKPADAEEQLEEATDGGPD